MNILTNCLNWISSVIKASFWFLLLQIYEVGCFLALSSICIGFGAFVNGINKYIWGWSIPPFIITSFTTYLLAMCSQSQTFCHDTYFAPFWLRKEVLYPRFLTMLPSMIHGIAYLSAFYLLFYQYELVHTLPKLITGENGTVFDRDAEMKKVDKGDMIIKSDMEMTREDINIYTVFFNLSICLLAYMTVKAMKKDIFDRARVPNPTSFNHFISTALFLILQFFLMFLYSIPIAITCLLLKLVVLEPIPAILITQIVACLMGFVGVYIEIRSPFPIRRHRPRFYAFENQIRARLIFLQFCIVPLIPLLFFQRGKVYPFNSFYEGFLLFNFFVGLMVLHITKLLFYSWTMNEEEVEVHAEDLRRELELVEMNQGDQNGLEDFALQLKDVPSNNNNRESSEFHLKSILKNRDQNVHDVYQETTSLSSRTLNSIDQQDLVGKYSFGEKYETDLHRSSGTTALGENGPSTKSTEIESESTTDESNDKKKVKTDPVICFGPLDLSESHNEVRHLLHSEEAFVNRDLLIQADKYSGFQTDDSDTDGKDETIKNSSRIKIFEKETKNFSRKESAEDLNKNE